MGSNAFQQAGQQHVMDPTRARGGQRAPHALQFAHRVSMSTPQVLQAISGKLFVREQAKATVQWNEMLEEIRDGLRLTFKELVDALVEKLSPRPDGTRKKLVGVDRLLELSGHVQQEGRGRRRATARPGGGSAWPAQRSGRIPAAQGPGPARAGAGADAERESGAGHAGGGCAGEADCVAGVTNARRSSHLRAVSARTCRNGCFGLVPNRVVSSRIEKLVTGPGQALWHPEKPAHVAQVLSLDQARFMKQLDVI
jgi:hypothetical protein